MTCGVCVKVKQVRRVLPLIKDLIKCNIQPIIENAVTSMLWNAPGLAAIAHRKDIHMVIMVPRAVRPPWRTHTRLRRGPRDDYAVCWRGTHKCTRRHACSYTGKRDLHLTSSDTTGRTLTARAQECPRSLRRRLAIMRSSSISSHQLLCHPPSGPKEPYAGERDSGD